MGRARYSVREEIKDTTDAFYRALSQRNLKNIEAVWAQSPYATVVGMSGDVHHGWPQVRLFWELRLQQLTGTGLSIKLVNSHCHAVGDVGWISGIERRTITMGDKQDVVDMRMTAVLERSSTGWCIVSYHASVAQEDVEVMAPAS